MDVNTQLMLKDDFQEKQHLAKVHDLSSDFNPSHAE